MIKNRDLARLSGVPSATIRDWRRRGLLPKDEVISRRWIAVVSDVFVQEKKLDTLFATACAKRGLLRGQV